MSLGSQIVCCWGQALTNEALQIKSLFHRRGAVARGAKYSGQLGQERRQEHAAARTQERLSEHALELADVPRPRVRAQPCERVWRDLANLSAQLDAEPPEIVLHEDRQIIHALAQRRQVDRENSEAVIQVRPKFILGRADAKV